MKRIFLSLIIVLVLIVSNCYSWPYVDSRSVILQNKAGYEIDNNNPLSTSPADNAGIDAFCRQRVSNPETIFDSKNIYRNTNIPTDNENQPLYYDNQETSGSGTATEYKPNESTTYLYVSDSTAGTRVRQTKQRFNYQPGKSVMVFMSFCFIDQTEGISKREGLFDEKNGLFFEDTGATYNLVVRSYTTGVTVDNKVAQEDWNIDPLDGTGKSGITADFTKAQILIMDYEWLGVGRVRMGFVIDGCIYYVHEFLHANNITTTYMQTPNLPLRSEIENDGTGSASSMTQICSTVISEGGQNKLGTVRSANTGGTHIDLTAENTRYAVLGIRLKEEYIGETIEIIRTEMQIHTATDRVLWEVLYSPEVSGTFTYNDICCSAIQYAVGSTSNTVSGNYILDSGFLESGGSAVGRSGSSSEKLENGLKLGSFIDGTVETIVLCATPIGGSTAVDVEGSITWRELN